jgi:hypothetical protein
VMGSVQRCAGFWWKRWAFFWIHFGSN